MQDEASGAFDTRAGVWAKVGFHDSLMDTRHLRFDFYGMGTDRGHHFGVLWTGQVAGLSRITRLSRTTKSMIESADPGTFGWLDCIFISLYSLYLVWNRWHQTSAVLFILTAGSGPCACVPVLTWGVMMTLIAYNTLWRDLAQ